MSNIKKILSLLVVLFAWQIGTAQVVIPRQEIHYNVNYHWGIIDVMIARGTVSVECDGYRLNGTLDGTSIPWEGRIICVSDTLVADVNGINETVVYQNGWYRRPPVSLFRSASYNPDDPAYYKNIAGQGAYDASHDSMEAITVTSDMISMYYYAHAINFQNLRPGEQVRINIDGPYSRELLVTYQGQGVYSAGGDNYPTYDCSFEYGYGGSLSGYPVECRIGANNRIPLYLSASLPVGKVEMLYDPY